MAKQTTGAVNMTSNRRKAGWIQTGTFCVFLAAALVGGYAVINENYIFAAINGALMIVNFILYQTASNILRFSDHQNVRVPGERG